MSNMVYRVFDYIGFLGDPASAIWGAFSELSEDWWLSRQALSKHALRRELLAAAILAGQTEFNATTEKMMTDAITLRVLLDMLTWTPTGENHKSQHGKAAEIAPVQITVSEKTSSMTAYDAARLCQWVRNAIENKTGLSSDVSGDPWKDVTKALVLAVENAEKPEDCRVLLEALSTATLGNEVKDMDKLRLAVDHMTDGGSEGSTDEESEYRPRPLLRPDGFTHKLWYGNRILLEAKVDFISTILIPVVLMLAVTASVFYDAYNNLGDNDTSHSLAYGLLYAWLIILAVAGNCYTSGMSAGLLEKTIGHILPLSKTTVRLRDRYTNALRWRMWLARVGALDPLTHRTRYVVRYLLGQLFGWACVAIAASCAAAISYTTPTVGIGCRSFNHLLYALVSLLVALIPVFQYWRESHRQSVKYNHFVTLYYRVLVFCNALILLLGTLFHLIGLFRSCWCMNLFVRSTRILELNSNTALAVHNATVYWLPVGYVTFIFIWIVCVAAIVMRQYISFNVGILQTMALEDTFTGGWLSNTKKRIFSLWFGAKSFAYNLPRRSKEQ
jgi:hypothetical protein